MSYYSVYKTDDLKKSIECNCGKCDNYKEFFHAPPMCFTRDFDVANSFFKEGTTLIQYDYYSEYAMNGKRITSRDSK